MDEIRLVQLLFFILTSYDFFACQGQLAVTARYHVNLDTFVNPCADNCRPHGIREVSECTSGFASVLHIEVVQELTDLHVHDGRQALIPAMTFNCSGSITKWIFSALWEGNSQGFTELQLWRKSSNGSNMYFKVGATTIRVNSESLNKLYEFPVNPPLAFLAGDILGYFQPNENLAQLSLYLEDSARISVFREGVEDTQTVPPSEIFDFNTPHFTGRDYPLVGAEIGTCTYAILA